MKAEKEILQEFREGTRYLSNDNQELLGAIVDNQELILKVLLNIRALLFHK